MGMGLGHPQDMGAHHRQDMGKEDLRVAEPLQAGGRPTEQCFVALTCHVFRICTACRVLWCQLLPRFL